MISVATDVCAELSEVMDARSRAGRKRYSEYSKYWKVEQEQMEPYVGDQKKFAHFNSNTCWQELDAGPGHKYHYAQALSHFPYVYSITLCVISRGR